MISSILRPRTLSNDSDTSSSTVTGGTIQDVTDAYYLPRLRRSYRSTVAPNDVSLRKQLGNIPTRSKTLDDAPNLNGRIRTLGSHCFAMGGFADIWKGILDNDIAVAVKVFRNISNDEEFTDKLKTRLQREATVWLQLEHPYVMPFLGICQDFDDSNMPSLVSPYLSNHDVNKYLRRTPDLDPSASLRFLAQAGEALAYLHDQNVVHGDVKGSNIMVDDEENAILTDFGISRMRGSSGYTTKSLAGSVRWMARELLTYEDEIVSRESDVWSFGMTILEVLTRKLPYDEIRKDTIVLLAVMRGDLPSRPSSDAVTDGIWELLVNCWASDPKDRPSIESIADALWRLYSSKDGDDFNWVGEFPLPRVAGYPMAYATVAARPQKP